jgi:hypothetical protein
MTESLTANIAALQELVRSQQEEIGRLKKRAGAFSVRERLEIHSVCRMQLR